VGDIDRYKGSDGFQRVVDAFYQNALSLGSRQVAEELAKVCVIESFDPGQALMEQGGSDTDFFFILFGAAVIERYDRPGPIRRAGTHVGEMALIDVYERRSATVRAIEETVVARIHEQDFTRIAEAHPELWRCLAKEIASRLRQRLLDVPRKNPRPFVFIGSSSEGKATAESLQNLLNDGTMDVRIWSDGVFDVSDTAIESLENMVRESDFAVLVLTPDDAIKSRGTHNAAPRDNVIFELGLFMGALGRKRVFALCETPNKMSWRQRFFSSRPKALKIPTDLLGVTTLRYRVNEDGKPDLTGAVKDLRKRFDDGPK